MRRPCRQEKGRVRPGRNKKLTAAFRYDLERNGQNKWLAKIAAEFPLELPKEKVPTRPEEARAEYWHDFYWRAWEALRFDRQYGAMGGESPIAFIAYDAYAKRYGLEGEAFERFHAFMTAIDTEWLIHIANKTKEREANKT
ncbi:hypothetical protein [Mesorhizobium sp.]|uniref:phage tail assembly chaperone n=1 Tax=Mesorhizobium sp. TaxID=1871066 RepID=UPI000FE2FB67|nr:hypothetical protein [Mesorhizobium sp.]RWQ16087.1 MAG: hypothetical protein EOR92_22695 [Mesorhizobium sp.]